MFAVVAAATVGAVFLTQHLKITVPLIQGYPNPVPAAFNPVSGRICKTRSGRQIDFRKTWISFTLANSDTVDAYIFNSAGRLVQTVKTGTRIAAQARSPRFYWSGKDSSGNFVPAGTYYWRFVLERENRTIALNQTPMTVIRTAPQPKITSTTVTPGGGGVGAAAGPAIITPRKQSATIRFTKADYRQVIVKLWRTDAGRPRLVDQYPLGNPTLGVAQWNGVIHGRTAPAGTYQVAVQVQDQACNQGTYPIAQPPVIPVANTGVTVRYLAVQPPLGPVPAGSKATVFVDSRLRPYRWSLRPAGGGPTLAHGSEPHGTLKLAVRLPRGSAGLYALTVRSDDHTTTVPLVASATAGGGGRVLVVLPMLTWQGLNEVDDTGGGLPDTLASNEPIQLQRPFANGLPAGFGEQAALLHYLTASHRHFQLTTDVALAEGAGAGPSLSGHRGVILDGPFKWLPENLVSDLRAYARAGGRVLSVGAPSLQAQAPLQRTRGTLTAGPPAPLSPDPFGAHHGSVSTTAGEIIAEQSDPLGIFSVTLALTGFPRFQTITPPNGVRASTAGVAAEAPAIIGFHSGSGKVVQIGLPRFQSSLQHNVASQQLMGRIWTLLSS